MTTPTDRPDNQPNKSFFMRMFDPRATYHPNEKKDTLFLWILFIAGFATIGILTIIAIIMSRNNKKLLKQFALTIFYVSIVFSLITVPITIVFLNRDFPWLDMFGLPAIIIGFVLALYAQRKIDNAPPP